MTPNGEVTRWAVALIRTRLDDFEKLRHKAVRHWKRGKQIHKLRTRARRLRAALEDLCECTPGAPDLLAKCKELSDCTTAARDTVVMMERLKRYRRFALPAEHAEISKLLDDLAKENAQGIKDAKSAVKACCMELQP